jgi:hypothetical protein
VPTAKVAKLFDEKYAAFQHVIAKPTTYPILPVRMRRLRRRSTRTGASTAW